MAEKGRNNIKRDYFWNAIGSGIYALSSMVLAFAAMHIAGPEDGGIFGFGFSAFGQQMFIIAYFGVRPFHITDSSYEYSYADYRKLRRISVLTAVAAALVYLAGMSISGSYTARKAAIIFLLALYKVADGIADLYESECQRAGVLWLGGMELAGRTVLASLTLVVGMLITGDVLTASAMAVLVQAACCIYFKLYTEKRVFTAGNDKHSDDGASEPFAVCMIRQEENGSAVCTGNRAEENSDAGSFMAGSSSISSKDRTGQLAGSTVLLFLSVFVDFYIFSASKYAIDIFLTDSDSGIFNILFMPTSVIYLAANFIIRPYMTRLSELYEKRELAAFNGIVQRLAMAVLAMSAAAVIGAAVLGRFCLWILELILGSQYAGMLTEQSFAFILIILGGCFYAMSNLFYYILIIMRKQRLIFTVYVIVAVFALFMSTYAVRTHGLIGAAVVYPCYMAIATSLFVLICCIQFHSSKA